MKISALSPCAVFFNDLLQERSLQVRPRSGDSSEVIGNSTVCVCVYITLHNLCCLCLRVVFFSQQWRTGVAHSKRNQNHFSCPAVLTLNTNTCHGHRYSYCLFLVQSIMPVIVGVTNRRVFTPHFHINTQRTHTWLLLLLVSVWLVVSVVSDVSWLGDSPSIMFR